MSGHSAEIGAGRRHPCCACCEGIAKDDHVQHGGSVDKDGHEVPCLECDLNARLAEAWERGYGHGIADGQMPEGWLCAVNPYVISPGEQS